MGRIIFFYVLPLVLTIYCLVSAIISKDSDVRHLPKVAWILLILFFPFLGSVAWLVAGRPVGARRPRSAYEREVPQFPEYDRPGRAAAADPVGDEEFLRQVRERAEQQRRAYDEKRRREQQELEAERERRRSKQRREADPTAE